MKKHIFTLMALAAALCACNKEQMIESEVTNPEIEPSAPLVFTATMEDAPDSKATFDNTAKCAAWEVGDQISVNGAPFYSQSAGTSSFFSKVPQEIRPTYIGSSDKGHYGDDKPSNLVDDGGTSTRWCAHKDQRTDFMVISPYWMISVSTGRPTILKTIKLWNANNTASYPNRVWKDIKVLGRLSSAGGDYTTIKTIYNLNLVANNSGLAGEIDIDATVPYDEYRIIIYNNKGDDYMQMADMKFVVYNPDIESPYTAYFPETLYNGGQTTLPSVITETWTDGKFNMPMYAQSNTTDLQFKNLCGVLKIAVKKETIASVKSIRISSSNKATSGAFTVSNNTAILASPDVPANTLTVMYTNAFKTSDEGTAFYVAIPAQTYQNLKIELSSDGVDYTKSVTTTKNANIAVARNKIYSINFTDVVNNKGRGKAKATIGGKEVDVNWVQLWENGPKFAEYNVGVTNGKAESYGGYYAWGGSQNKVDDHNTGTEVLTDDNDTATKLWGSAWRMPTKAELDDLLANCDGAWTKVNGVDGRKFTGEGDFASNSVFLPAAGYCLSGNVSGQGFNDYCWSSTPSSSSGACYLYSSSVSQRVDYSGRRRGCSVRAVLK